MTHCNGIMISMSNFAVEVDVIWDIAAILVENETFVKAPVHEGGFKGEG